MDFKVRKESLSLLEKVFQMHERRGIVRSYQMPTLLRTLNPGIQFDEEELRSVASLNEVEGNGLDFDSFTRTCMHFLVRQARRDSDDFSHKNEIGPHDFASS